MFHKSIFFILNFKNEKLFTNVLNSQNNLKIYMIDQNQMLQAFFWWLTRATEAKGQAAKTATQAVKRKNQNDSHKRKRLKHQLGRPNETRISKP